MKGDAAGRHDPPLRRLAWCVETALAGDAFLEEVRRRVDDDAGFARLMRHGGLHVDGRPVAGEWGCGAPPRCEAGGRIVVWVMERDPEPVAVGPGRVLLDQEGAVAVDKPAWLPMQGTRASRIFCLERALRELLGCPSLVAVNRLDRQTSGVALFARDAAAASWLGAELAGHRTARRYLAVVAPPPAEPRFEVAGFLGRRLHPTRFRFALSPTPSPGARHSHTRFERLAEAGGRALLAAEPTTGRTHQIRVHLAAAGSPVVGDDLYGAPGSPGPPGSADRILLHASRLGMRLPSGRLAEVVAATPSDLAGALAFAAG